MKSGNNRREQWVKLQCPFHRNLTRGPWSISPVKLSYFLSQICGKRESICTDLWGERAFPLQICERAKSLHPHFFSFSWGISPDVHLFWWEIGAWNGYSRLEKWKMVHLARSLAFHRSTFERRDRFHVDFNTRYTFSSGWNQIVQMGRGPNENVLWEKSREKWETIIPSQICEKIVCHSPSKIC